MERVDATEAIPPSCRQKICNIKMVGISQAESNNIKACALPSIHLPLTREASVMVQSKGWCGFGRVGGVTIPPVVARIFSGDSTSPLTREARVLAIFEG